jgi:hypothetical protein
MEHIEFRQFFFGTGYMLCQHTFTIGKVPPPSQYVGRMGQIFVNTRLLFPLQNIMLKQILGSYSCDYD